MGKITRLDLEISYMAGFFDGEGCVRIYPVGAKHYLQVSVTQKFPAILERFREMWGGKIYHVGERGAFKWVPSAKYSFMFLRDILPYVKEKKAQVLIALLFRRRQLRKKLSPELSIYCYRTLQKLKRIPANSHDLAKIRETFRKESRKFRAGKANYA